MPGEVVFVRYFVELPLPFDVAEKALLGALTQRIPGLADDAVAHGQALLAEAGSNQGRLMNERVAVTLGPVVRHPLRTVLAMTWRPASAPALSPALDGDIQLGGLGRQRTQLSISARYRPALGTVELGMDRAILRRVAEATIKNFLDRVGQVIECRVGSPSSGQPCPDARRSP